MARLMACSTSTTRRARAHKALRESERLHRAQGLRVDARPGLGAEVEEPVQADARRAEHAVHAVLHGDGLRPRGLPESLATVPVADAGRPDAALRRTDRAPRRDVALVDVDRPGAHALGQGGAAARVGGPDAGVQAALAVVHRGDSL